MDGVAGPAPAQVIETHISTVVLLGDRALKFPKPIVTSFLDQSTPARRRAACEQELALNRRLAPDVYLGIGDVREGDTVVDSFLVMRRLPVAQRLSALVGTPRLRDAVRETVRVVAAFHARQEPTAFAASLATQEATRALWFDKNLDQMHEYAGELLDPAQLTEVASLADAYVAGRGPLFASRIDAGLARDGHGDLLADDIFVLPDGPRILDCLAFDESLRCGDVLLDLAFLAMDLERLAGPAIVECLFHWYGEFSGEHHPRSLADFFVAYRALVRAKVACVKAGQQDETARASAEESLTRCLRHLRSALPRLVLVGGPPGTGKSTVAGILADAAEVVVLSSDELRKDLAGRPRTERLGDDAYGAAARGAVYDVMLARARTLLEHGESVVLDATWGDASWRDAARALADETRSRLVALRCDAPADEVARRVSARASSGAGAGASDADPEVAARLAASFAPWPDAHRIDTGATPEEVCAVVCARVLAP